jgi:hypothetical protein
VASDRLHAVLNLEKEPGQAARPSPLRSEAQKLAFRSPRPRCPGTWFASDGHRRKTWRTFLGNHLRSLLAVDFFTAGTVYYCEEYAVLDEGGGCIRSPGRSACAPATGTESDAPPRRWARGWGGARFRSASSS